MNTTTTNPASNLTGPASFTLSIDGMTCGHCVQAVTKVLAAVPGVGVRSVAVGSAQITAPDGLTVARAVNALGEAGYAAKASEADRLSRPPDGACLTCETLSLLPVRPVSPGRAEG